MSLRGVVRLPTSRYHASKAGTAATAAVSCCETTGGTIRFFFSRSVPAYMVVLAGESERYLW